MIAGMSRHKNGIRDVHVCGMLIKMRAVTIKKVTMMIMGEGDVKRRAQ